ncbi:hypothetical protein Pelo_14875 [Pelomyxa schiedti]|nr:hypothetical protein Pelo_14875 [Pelomyxa schiedti]
MREECEQLVLALENFDTGEIDACFRSTRRALGHNNAHAPSLLFLEKVLVVMHPQCQLDEALRPSTYGLLSRVLVSKKSVEEGQKFFDTYFPTPGASHASLTMHALWNKFFKFDDPVAMGLLKQVPPSSKWYPVTLHQIALYYFYGSPDIPSMKEKNLTRAMELFKEAGELGNTNALFSLGYCYRYSRSDTVQADFYYQRSASLGNAVAKYSQALNLQVTLPDESFQLWKEAAELGDVGAINGLRALYGNRKEPDKELEWQNKAVKLGIVTTCMELVRTSPPSSPNYLECLRNAAHSGSARAALRLQEIFFEGLQNPTGEIIIKRNLQEALRYAALARECYFVDMKVARELQPTIDTKMLPYNESIALIEHCILRQNQALAVLLGNHARTGPCSAVSILPQWFVCEIAQILLHLP